MELNIRTVDCRFDLGSPIKSELSVSTEDVGLLGGTKTLALVCEHEDEPTAHLDSAVICLSRADAEWLRDRLDFLLG